MSYKELQQQEMDARLDDKMMKLILKADWVSGLDIWQKISIVESENGDASNFYKIHAYFEYIYEGKKYWDSSDNFV